MINEVVQKKIFYNDNYILLIFLDEIKNNESIIEYTLKILDKISKIYREIILFSTKKEIKEEGYDESHTILKIRQY